MSRTNSNSNSTATIVWLVLMLATCLSTWGLKGGIAASFAASAAIMLIAGVKVRLVIIHFMELDHAPTPWRLFFEAWWIVVTAIIVIGFRLGAS